MLLFDSSRLPAQLPSPLIFERTQELRQSEDPAKAELKERVISVMLLFCVLAAGLYGEMLRYGY